MAKTESVWKHVPVLNRRRQEMEEAELRYSPDENSDDDDSEGEFACLRRPENGEEELLFRDCGYGSGGMLPGLDEMALWPSPEFDFGVPHALDGLHDGSPSAVEVEPARRSKLRKESLPNLRGWVAARQGVS